MQTQYRPCDSSAAGCAAPQVHFGLAPARRAWADFEQQVRGCSISVSCHTQAGYVAWLFVTARRVCVKRSLLDYAKWAIARFGGLALGTGPCFSEGGAGETDTDF